MKRHGKRRRKAWKRKQITNEHAPPIRVLTIANPLKNGPKMIQLLRYSAGYAARNRGR
jgi:hypothetical protein